MIASDRTCAPAVNAGPSIFDVFEKCGNKYGSSDEWTAPISKPGSAVTSGAFASANSYSNTATYLDASFAVCKKRQLFKPLTGVKSDMTLPKADGGEKWLSGYSARTAGGVLPQTAPRVGGGFFWL